ncbi:putative peroxisomal membrane protein prx5-like peroxiredoxin [Triangularia setosa]|uniref:Peroxisomal membrane protein prx5-like peroxiredoxin n=1 Tax=Triangularia setosa TaxID=2587417 RepID=A0AAN6WE76_9PEZI|nr:putative peroxisomal membrane protein prx5-like peroxiredoxin [Podospora setosa]
MSLLRPLARAAFRPATTPFRAFSTTPLRFIKPGQPLPDVGAILHESTPGNKVNLADEASKLNNLILIGVPAAFSPACSATHVPGFLAHPKAAEYDQIAVVSVNDVFVMKAWGDVLDPEKRENVRFLADPSGEFTKALDMLWDGKAIFGNERSKRYTIVVEGGKVKSVAVEPDNTGTSVSLAENVLGKA